MTNISQKENQLLLLDDDNIKAEYLVVAILNSSQFHVFRLIMEIT